MTKPRPHIQAMAPYALADLSAPDGVPLVSLSQNESCRPPSPLAIEAACRAFKDAALYPDPDWTKLRDALGDHHGLDPHSILCGNGSLDLISCIARTFAGPDRAVLTSAHAYPFFRTVAAMSNARCDTAPEDNATISVDALIAATRPDTGVVFVANPGNPTGTRIPLDELIRLRTALRDDVLLIIDEAYGEFSDHLNERAFDQIATGNTVVLRTFSKAYGLAAARVGWGAFPPDIAMQMRKVMNPNTLTMASEAAAVAALKDHAYMRETCDITITCRDRAADRLRAHGLTVYPSFTNFLLIDFGTTARADAMNASLKSEGIILRAQGGAGLPTCLRMTIGPEDHVLQALNHIEREVAS